jgi:hypothetical protein
MAIPVLEGSYVAHWQSDRFILTIFGRLEMLCYCCLAVPFGIAIMAWVQFFSRAPQLLLRGHATSPPARALEGYPGRAPTFRLAATFPVVAAISSLVYLSLLTPIEYFEVFFGEAVIWELSYYSRLGIGWPRRFFDSCGIDCESLAFDVAFAGFIITGALLNSRRSRACPSAVLSLRRLAVFVSAVCFFLAKPWLEGFDPFPDPSGLFFAGRIAYGFYALVSVTFAFALVGWCRLLSDLLRLVSNRMTRRSQPVHPPSDRVVGTPVSNKE